MSFANNEAGSMKSMRNIGLVMAIFALIAVTLVCAADRARSYGPGTSPCWYPAHCGRGVLLKLSRWLCKGIETKTPASLLCFEKGLVQNRWCLNPAYSHELRTWDSVLTDSESPFRPSLPALPLAKLSLALRALAKNSVVDYWAPSPDRKVEAAAKVVFLRRRLRTALDEIIRQVRHKGKSDGSRRDP